MRLLQPPTCTTCEKTGHERNECAYINGMNHPPVQDKFIDNNLWARAYEFIRRDFGTYRGYSGRYPLRGSRCGLCGLFGHFKINCAYNPGKWTVDGEPSRALREEQARITHEYLEDEYIESQLYEEARRSRIPPRVHQPIQNLNPQQEKAFEATECPVCCESLAETNKVITRCGHQFCVTCFVQSLDNKKNECPMCRDNVLERDMIISVE